MALVATEFANAALALPIGFVDSRDFRAGDADFTDSWPEFCCWSKGRMVSLIHPGCSARLPLLASFLGRRGSYALDRRRLGRSGGRYTEKFFNDDGSLAPAVSELLKLLRHVHENRIFTNQAAVALSDAGVIKRWNLILPVGDRQVPVGGLYSVDEVVLISYDDAGLLAFEWVGSSLSSTCVNPSGDRAVASRLSSGEGRFRFWPNVVQSSNLQQ